jgi:sugar/nucleoside kinase (ribokinase family)
MAATKAKSSSGRRGLLAGGNWIIDQVKLIDVYPQREQLANILSQSQGTGGAPYNVLIDLAKLGANFPLYGAGLVGKDGLGQYIQDDCRKHGIDCRHLRTTSDAPTSFTDVMTEQSNGRRTFFHARGANALWKGEDLDFRKNKAQMFHLGYLLLLDELDEPDTKFGTKAARLLAAAQEAGLKTSVDVVSEDSDRFARIVTPALKYASSTRLKPAKPPDLRSARLMARWTRCRCGMPPARSSSRVCASWLSSTFPKADLPARARGRMSGSPP